MARALSVPTLTPAIGTSGEPRESSPADGLTTSLLRASHDAPAFEDGLLTVVTVFLTLLTLLTMLVVTDASRWFGGPPPKS